MAKRPDLMVTGGELAGKRFSVKEDGLRLGRSSSNDIHIPDEQLSRNHCIFEPAPDDGIKLTDLASANGTFVNGEQLGGDPVVLKAGDTIDAGSLHLVVVGEEMPKAAVDLGLHAEAKADPSDGPKGKGRPSRSGLLWLVAFAILAAAVAVIVLNPLEPKPAEPAAVAEAADDQKLSELYYEKVDANQDGIFRYELTLSADGVLKVTVDDVPKENRHLVKSEKLDEAALAELADIVAFRTVKEIDREYVGVEPDPPALSSYSLKVVYSTRARRISIVNTAEPEAFRTIREKLEAFSKNQLGVWALQYSRDKLIELAEESVKVARGKWDDREVSRGNLFGAVAAYREALFYLETVNPKPECAAVAKAGLDESVRELERRYEEQRFLVDRAINLQQWDTARGELAVLMEMIPDRADERYREASAKLMDVEKRMKAKK